jgi:hypothetical protein
LLSSISTKIQLTTYLFSKDCSIFHFQIQVKNLFLRLEKSAQITEGKGQTIHTSVIIQVHFSKIVSSFVCI